jgi:hypothetical protein
MIDRYQAQRYELKYFITQSQAARVREIVRSYLQPDDYSLGADDYSYPVHSIYLDSIDLTTYWATVHCEKSRFKLRVRYYDENPEAPVFLEIKRRLNETVRKQRAAVRRDTLKSLIAGEFPEPHHMFGGSVHQLGSAQMFSTLMHQLHAAPKVHVAYQREAWVDAIGNAVRVTLDRAVRGVPMHDLRLTTEMSDPVLPFGEQVVLELKFTNRFPNWFGSLVRQLNLTQCGVQKYCGSLDLVRGDGAGARHGASRAAVRWHL